MLGESRGFVRAWLRRAGFCLAIAAALTTSACTPGIPETALQLKPDSLKLRQLQTRRFDTADELKLLKAGAGVLQDLGFNIDESETKLGVIVGSKDRDATEAGQIAGAVVIAILFGVMPATDKEQKIRASLISKPIDDKSIAVRITFQRIVWNNQGQVSRTESIEDAAIYQEFFDKFSKAVFLSANEI
jgi:hypothetical protein